MWRDEQTLWDVMSPLYKILFQMQKLFSAYTGDS